MQPQVRRHESDKGRHPCVESIKEDVRWLGFVWNGEPRYASDYFEQLEYAEHLIKAGKAYVDSLPADEMRAYRGTLTEAGKESPFRSRSVDENLDMFRRMRAGEFELARTSCARRSTWRRRTSTCAIRRSTGSAAPTTIEPARPGAIYPMYDMAHPVGCDRAHHAFALHARVRRSPSALRLADREPAPCRRRRVRSSSRG